MERRSQQFPGRTFKLEMLSKLKERVDFLATWFFCQQVLMSIPTLRNSRSHMLFFAVHAPDDKTNKHRRCHVNTKDLDGKSL